MRGGWNLEHRYAELPEAFFQHVHPTPVRAPELVVLNDRLAESLGLDPDALRSEEGVAVLAGNRVPEGSLPIAQAYAGHQFGYFTMLGDGRAILLGEQITPTGERYDIQLKGSGPTAYSRGGDGRAALGPMLREYIISEAMHALGIPTTRSLAVVTTGEVVFRETFLPGAVLTRVASSHLRVGTFQYAAAYRTRDELQALADHALQRHEPDVDPESPDRYLQLLRGVVERQADLISQWQLVGFIHGVMNTDNMTISGETIDYGPCAFMNEYDPATVFSSIDRHGRYAYGNQPSIGGWNLARFAEALLPLLHEETDKAIELAQECVSAYADLYRRRWLAGMRRKLGLINEEEGDAALIDQLLTLMHRHRADFTNTFRALTLGQTEQLPMHDVSEWKEWHERWLQRLARQPIGIDEARRRMKQVNPAVIPRNHRVEEALSAAVDHGDLSVMQRLLDALADPYRYAPEQEEYVAPPPPSPVPYRTFCGT